MTESGELIFIQLPDTLPGEPPHDEDNVREQTPSNSQTQDDDTPIHPQEELAKRLGLTSMQQFSEGYIGKIQVHKSGRTTLVLGNVELDMSMGTPSGFLQVCGFIIWESREAYFERS